MLDQLALAALIESGRYDRHLRRMRSVYAGKRRALLAALAAARARRRAARPRRRLPRRRAAAATARESTRSSPPPPGAPSAVHALGDYRVADGDWPPALVLGFGNLGEGAIERGIAAIGDLLTRDRPGS